MTELAVGKIFIAQDPLADFASDDEILYARFLQEDYDATKMLIERHAAKVRAIARNILADPHEAEDVVQEVFISLWQRRHSREALSARFSTWLYRIAINKAIDFRRRRKATPEPHEVITQLLDTADRAMRGSEEGDAGLEKKELAATLQLALGELPQTQRTALHLFYFEEMDVAKISAFMCISEQAVRSLLKRGKEALRKRFNPQETVCEHDSGRIQGNSGKRGA